MRVVGSSGLVRARLRDTPKAMRSEDAADIGHQSVRNEVDMRLAGRAHASVVMSLGWR